MTTERHPTVLLVEDDIVAAECYKNYLEKEPINLIPVNTGKAALLHLQQAIPAAILLDLGLPDMDGIEIIKYVKQHRLSCAIIVITAEHSIDVVVKTMRYGIFNFLEKPVQTDQLITTLRQALSNKNSYPVDFKQFIPPPEKIQQYHQFIGASPPMQEIYQIIEKIAKCDVTVFITGETGTGKELCADAIHQQSLRRDKPYIVFDCATISHDLMESQLFGHVKSAFTGADKARKGTALSANGGTLFLDEIGEMDLELQKKLLRFVE
ncbi:MAG: sigma-54-dependent Fis family transcriptional regulator, partial [Candidatus Parabeggiatoa sp. nov. 1]